MATKPTLLEITQQILMELTSDEVNSISDTEDSEEVASHIKATYNALMNKREWPHTRRALTVNPRSDSDYPTHMYVKENLRELSSISYNKMLAGETRKKYSELSYLTPDEFLRKINARNSDASDVVTVTDDSGIELLIKDDQHPEYYTSFDETNIIFDSYKSDVDSTLQTSKMQAIGFILPEFLLEDSFVPDLPIDAFPLLIEESTARAQFKMRQFVDNKAEQESNRQRRHQSFKSWTVGGGLEFPNYGRKR